MGGPFSLRCLSPLVCAAAWVGAKVLSYLSACARRQGGAEFDIAFSRQQLADYLSVDRSGLSAELCHLRDEGLLEFRREHFRLIKPLEEGWE